MSRQQAHTSSAKNKQQTYGKPRQNSYIEGNTVRKLQEVPDTAPGRQREREEKNRVDRAARANRERAQRLNPAYIMFLTMALAVTVVVCVAYIQLQSDINTRMKAVSSLENQVLDLKTENDAAIKRIETSINMEAIKNTAINELGMVYPAKDQIVYFEVDKNDYMNQYQDIPED